MEKKLQPLAELKFPSEPELDTTIDVGDEQEQCIDREGAMAKADLYKLSQYSYKLFKKIEDEDQLESWVQAKITKAADYLASVYHYLEYEMKFSEYGHKLDNSDVLSESEKTELRKKLSEARSKIKELKLAQAEKLLEGKKSKPDFLDVDKDGDKDEPFKNAVKSKKSSKVEESLGGESIPCDKCGGTGQITTPAKKWSDEAKTKAKKYKRETEAFAAAAKRIDANKNGIPDDEEISENKPSAGLSKKPVKPAKKASKEKSRKDYDSDEDYYHDYPEAMPDSYAKPHERVAEGKPSAGLTKQEKSAVVKKAKAGKDIGKKGKGFADVAAKAAKTYGSKEKGEKVAAAAMWKNIKESVERSIEEGIFNTSPEEYAKNDPTMAELLKLQQQYQGTKWSKQIEDRIQFLMNRYETGYQAPQDAHGNTVKVLPPDAWDKKYPHGVKEDCQLDELDLKPWEKKSAFSKKGYDKVADRQTSKMKQAELDTDKADEEDDLEGLKKADQDWDKAKKFRDKAEKKSKLAKAESINESIEIDNLKKLSGL